MKFIVSDHLLCKVHRKNRKGQPFKECRKKKHHKERKIWMWFDVWKWKGNAGHTWQVDKDLELPLSWVKYGSWTCSSKSTALYIWCIKNDKMISHEHLMHKKWQNDQSQTKRKGTPRSRSQQKRHPYCRKTRIITILAALNFHYIAQLTLPQRRYYVQFARFSSYK